MSRGPKWRIFFPVEFSSPNLIFIAWDKWWRRLIQCIKGARVPWSRIEVRTPKFPRQRTSERQKGGAQSIEKGEGGWGSTHCGWAQTREAIPTNRNSSLFSGVRGGGGGGGAAHSRVVLLGVYARALSPPPLLAPFGRTTITTWVACPAHARRGHPARGCQGLGPRRGGGRYWRGLSRSSLGGGIFFVTKF